MRFPSYIATLIATGIVAAPDNDDWKIGDMNYKVVTKFKSITRYVIDGGDSPQTTCIRRPQKSDFDKEPDISKQHAPGSFYTEPTTVPFVKKPKQAPSQHSSSGFGSSYGLSADQQKAIDLHNEARKTVGNGPLAWDDFLASHAQDWAHHLSSIGLLQHFQGEDGENLYMGTTESPYSAAVEAFLAESSLYNGEAISTSNYMHFGHYTQCVWKSTTKIGMAVSKDNNGIWWVVARYHGPGNIIGEKPY